MSGDHRLWKFLSISLPFLAARARPGLGRFPFLAAPCPCPHRSLRHLEVRGSYILPQLESHRALWVGRFGRRVCTDGKGLRPPAICEDTSHTLASPESASGPASALRRGAEQGSRLTRKPPVWGSLAGRGRPSSTVHSPPRQGHCRPLSTSGSTFCFQLWPPPRCPWGERTGCSNRRHDRKWAVVLGKVGVGSPCERPVCRVASDAPSALTQPSLCYSADKALRFSAVVNSVFHTESLIVESLCLPPPFCLDSSNLIILPSPVS